jgi:hypothetical protein
MLAESECSVDTAVTTTSAFAMTPEGAGQIMTVEFQKSHRIGCPPPTVTAPAFRPKSDPLIVSVSLTPTTGLGDSHCGSMDSIRGAKYDQVPAEYTVRTPLTATTIRYSRPSVPKLSGDVHLTKKQS